MFHGHLDYFQKPPLGGRLITKPWHHGTPNAHNYWFILFYHVRGPAWIDIHWNSIWLRTRSRMTSHYTWGSVTTLHDLGGVLGRPLDTFLLGSHNFMVTALGSRAKWPLARGLFTPPVRARGIGCGHSWRQRASGGVGHYSVPSLLSPRSGK
jgi:hypothetical protein